MPVLHKGMKANWSNLTRNEPKLEFATSFSYLLCACLSLTMEFALCFLNTTESLTRGRAEGLFTGLYQGFTKEELFY